MAIKPDILLEICNLAERQVKELHPNFTSIFLLHENGTFSDVVDARQHEIFKHPSVKTIEGILEKNISKNQSDFLGLAITHELKWFGLSSRENMLALFNLNIDDFTSPADARHEIYHLIWHALDLIEIRRRREYAEKFRSGPMIPKRSSINLARTNVQADAFASIMCALQGEDNVIQDIALKRIMSALTPTSSNRAEDYPFVVALDTVRYAYEELLDLPPQRGKYMIYARQIAAEVGRTLDDKDIRDWWGFSEPALDMAWKKMAPAMILGCATHTGENPFVRTIAHLAGEIADITIYPSFKLDGYYNSYATQEQNRILHREMMQKAFEEIMKKGSAEEIAKALMATANEQNKKLADGLILGWCAEALQSTSQALNKAIISGLPPIQAARLQFEGTKNDTEWEALYKISLAVMENKRQGQIATLSSLAEICSTNPSYATVLSSIRVTMKDSQYVQTLQAANDLAMMAPPPYRDERVQ